MDLKHEATMAEPKSDLLRSNPLLQKAAHVVYGYVQINEIQIIRCESWAEFTEKVRVTASPLVGRVFRGQCESTWRLQSKWDRYAEQQDKIPEGDRAIAGRNETPDSLLERFQTCFTGTPGVETTSLTQQQWMAIGRHHGLITALLDWTRSPFVAAFFAVKELLPIDPELGCLDPLLTVKLDGNVAIWELPLVSACNNFEHFQFFSARHDFAHRQRAQSGLFSLCDHPEHRSLDSYLTSKGYAHCLKKYEVPKSDALIAAQDLTLMNITDSTMFPDGDGAARHANLGELLDFAYLLEHLRREER